MPIYKGTSTKNQTAISSGTTQMGRVFIGDKLVWRKYPLIPIHCGLYYNWFAVTDARGIAPAGWHVPSRAEGEALATFLGGSAIAGGKLKTVGLSYWESPNTDATNETGFNGMGTGSRIYDGIFGLGFIKLSFLMWTTTERTTLHGCDLSLGYNNSGCWVGVNQYNNKKEGSSVRLLKNDSNDPGTITDFDGNVYQTVKIGDQVWTTKNLIVRHYNNGDDIPNVMRASDWAELTTGAFSIYNNDEYYV